MDRIFVCSFDSALSDIPRIKRKNPKYVLGVLKNNPRFSCFEASEHMSLAKTLTKLKDNGSIVYKENVGYPWCEVEINERAA